MVITFPYLCSWWIETYTYFDLYGRVGDKSTQLKVRFSDQNKTIYEFCFGPDRIIVPRYSIKEVYSFMVENNVNTIDELIYYLIDNKFPYEKSE